MTKPRKVEEPANVYPAKPKPAAKETPAPATVRTANLADVRRTNAQLMQVHRKVLQKLAQ